MTNALVVTNMASSTVLYRLWYYKLKKAAVVRYDLITSNTTCLYTGVICCLGGWVIVVNPPLRIGSGQAHLSSMFAYSSGMI